MRGPLLVLVVILGLRSMDQTPSLEPHCQAEDENDDEDDHDVPRDREGVRAALIDTCKRAAAVVAQKSAAEADEYKRWLVSFARNSAEAAKEGGFLGIGSTLVSEEESSAVKELASALGVSAYGAANGISPG